MRQVIFVVPCKRTVLLFIIITGILWFGKEHVKTQLPTRFFNIAYYNLYQLIPHEEVHLTRPQPLQTTSIPTSSLQNILRKFYVPYRGPKISTKNWKGDCPYPFFIPLNMRHQSWFQSYLYHLQRLNLSRAAKDAGAKLAACTRWWSESPQLAYDERFVKMEPFRGQERLEKWKRYSKPSTNFTRPKCEGFGRQLVEKTPCGDFYMNLWRALDEFGVTYYPRAGTELGVARGSSYLNTDGDIDIFVDMPQRELLEKLRKVLSPAPYLDEVGGNMCFRTETHWWNFGCPTVHMLFNDWMTDELTKHVHSKYPRYTDTCECLMNSVPLSCHKETIYRTWLMYGPSWRVPLRCKALDVPYIAKDYSTARKLRQMVSKDGVIHEKAVRDLDNNIKYTANEMQMVLAQLNVLHALITCQGDFKCNKKLVTF